MLNKAELPTAQKMLSKRQANILPITAATTQQAIALMEELTLSHGLQMGDALIASTALVNELALLTGNVKHFSTTPGLRIEPLLI